jgi:hypothetical protein
MRAKEFIIEGWWENQKQDIKNSFLRTIGNIRILGNPISTWKKALSKDDPSTMRDQQFQQLGDAAKKIFLSKWEAQKTYNQRRGYENLTPQQLMPQFKNLLTLYIENQIIKQKISALAPDQQNELQSIIDDIIVDFADDGEAQGLATGFGDMLALVATGSLAPNKDRQEITQALNVLSDREEDILFGLGAAKVGELTSNQDLQLLKDLKTDMPVDKQKVVDSLLKNQTFLSALKTGDI